MFGLHVSPDLDTVMYTLGGGIHPEQGWGRSGETRAVQDELGAYGEPPDWFALGDKDIATHLVRTRMLREGATLSAATAALCARWQPGVRLLPMSDDPVTTTVDIEDIGGGAGSRRVHFQEYWVRLHAAPAALKIHFEGADAARPAPGVLDAVASADVVVFPPSNPVGQHRRDPRGAGHPLRGRRGERAGRRPLPVIRWGARPRHGRQGAGRDRGRDLRGGRRLHYGPDLLDGWLVDDADADAVAAVTAAGIAPAPSRCA